MTPFLMICFFLGASERYAIGIAHPPHQPLYDAAYAPHIGYVAKSLQAQVVHVLSSSVVLDIPTHVDIDRTLNKTHRVTWYEKDVSYPIHLKTFPNDPLFTDQWYLKPSPEGSLVHPDATMPYNSVYNALQNTTEHPNIAVLDDGFYLEHEDLQGQFILNGRDFVQNDFNAAASDHDYHGTQVAGVIAALTHNNTGLASLCPTCRIVPVRLINQTASSAENRSFFTTGTNIAAAISWAVAQNASVINNSWGPIDKYPYNSQTDSLFWPLPQVVKSELNYAITQGRNGKGTAVVWASGNGGELVTYDRFASDPNVIAIGAVDTTGTSPLYQDYGPPVMFVTSSGGIDESIHAITTTNNPYALEASSTFYVSTFNGTSASAAVASGVIGALLAVYPNLTLAQVIETLIQSAQKIDSTYGKYIEGRSSVYGYGKIMPENALAWASTHYNATLCTMSYELCGNNRDDNCNNTADADEPSCTPKCIPTHKDGAPCTVNDIGTACGKEACDGIDNNCDGHIDEDFACTPANRPLCAPCNNTFTCETNTVCTSTPSLLGSWCLKKCSSSKDCPSPFSLCNNGHCSLVPTDTLRTCRDFNTCETSNTCTQASSCQNGIPCNNTNDTTPDTNIPKNNSSEQSGCHCQNTSGGVCYILALTWAVLRKKIYVVLDTIHGFIFSHLAKPFLKQKK